MAGNMSESTDELIETRIDPGAANQLDPGFRLAAICYALTDLLVC
jgi:hypothetical protein